MTQEKEREHNTSVLGPKEIEILKNMIDSGSELLSKIDLYKDSLDDLLKDTSDKVGIKKTQLRKAVVASHKASMSDLREKIDEIQCILEATGRYFEK